MFNSVGNDLTVLVFAPFGKDSTLIERVLQQSGINACAIPSFKELIRAVPENGGAVIISEEVLHHEAVDELAQKLATQPRWSDFPLIVLTGGGATTDTTELAVRSRAPLGNVALLERPLRPVTLISSVRGAIAARRRQYEIRDHLLERKRAEEALQRAHDVLESLVEERTAALRALSGKLLRVQDEERRRIARELHDSLGQYLAAAKINLNVVATAGGDGTLYIQEASQLIDRAIADTRTLSHLLHPPLLDEAGFASAARWYVEGFGKRSGIAATLDMPDNLRRLPSPIETALFRILQEALTNVHRHSKSPVVDVSLKTGAKSVTLIIKDKGRGIPRQVLEKFRKTGTNVGVGLAGIRERVKELDGTLKIDSSDAGTLLKAVIPVSVPEQREAGLPVLSPIYSSIVH